VDATTPAAPAAVTAASAPAPDATLTVSASDVAKTEAPKEESTFYNWTTGGVFSNSAPISLGIASDTGVVAETDRFRDDAIFKDGIDKDRSLVVQNGGTVTDSFNFNSLDSTNSFGLLGSREPSPALAKSFDAPVSSPVPAAMPAPALTAQPGTPELADRSRAAEKKVVAGEIIANNAGQQVPQANLRFLRIENRGQYRRNLNSPPLPKVLTNFAVQRNGSNVSVRDADGSLYNGNIILDAEAAVLNGGKVSGYGGALPVLQNGNNMPEDTFAFRVSGYNGKLKQKIVFTGNVTNVVIVTNPIAVGYVQQNETRAQNSSQNLNAPQQQSPQQNLLLNGRVQVGRNTEFEIQAAPTK
jgi:hypothetical protein